MVLIYMIIVCITVISACLCIYQFSSRLETFTVLEESVYFDVSRMKPIDLIARDASSARSYREKYIASMSQFSTKQQQLLERLVHIIKTDHIQNTQLLQRLQWKFVKVRDDIEMGFPHTHGDTIVLSDRFFQSDEHTMLETLIHELIHVFQRAYPKATQNYIQHVLKFVDVTNVMKKDQTFLTYWNMSRNNPDIEGIYAWKGTYIPLHMYNNEHPRNIADSRVRIYNIKTQQIENDETEYHTFFPFYITQKEHPNEIMAVIIAMVLAKRSVPQDALAQETIRWVKQRL